MSILGRTVKHQELVITTPPVVDSAVSRVLYLMQLVTVVLVEAAALLARVEQELRV